MGLFGFGKPKDEALEAKISSLESKLKDKQSILDDLTRQIKVAKDILKLDDELKKRQSELKALQKEVIVLNDDLDLQEYGFFERKYKFSDSTKYKEELETLRKRQKQLVKDKKAGVIVRPMLLDNSKSKGRAMQNQLIKAMIRGFNGEVDAHLVKVTATNLSKKVDAVVKSFNQLNKMYSRNLVCLSNDYLELKISELQLAVEYELQKLEEKELLREQRAKEREDKKLQAELAAKRKQIEKDRKHFKQMLDNVEELLKTANEEEKEKLNLQLAEYQDKLSELDELEEDIDYREGHATAGYVYIISNIGAFGEDVYKIGVTRRLDPMERIRELGSASVPFQFDVHALIFSEEAFSLEKELHNRFEKNKINKVNGRKEYFKVPFSDIKAVLEEHKELAIELTEKAEAFEYRQSLMTK
ncbi:TPA: DUF4041 domain-containing protein [Streptococcus agalactiae]|uniref:Laminin-like protein epi-1 n=3 Tax=Streptococcus TaxID=1301 RepID=A0AB38VJL1_STRAG|nr:MULTISPECIES: DUF4041 domain-containing protein [Streptococcus]MBR3054620.1 DUF4041 domain-containing protein [Streptococcus sp.]HEP1447689.1 DUF4041 domain-containing protein [Streptococcus pyogenes]AKI56544.1 ATPase [Streptococcus agalactiae]AMD31463.1 ATPase [Streptococcus agalactiae]ARC24004.1 DUF4041 domain-containing protein [Streptococcus sp. 'group B']